MYVESAWRSGPGLAARAVGAGRTELTVCFIGSQSFDARPQRSCRGFPTRAPWRERQTPATVSASLPALPILLTLAEHLRHDVEHEHVDQDPDPDERGEQRQRLAEGGRSDEQHAAPETTGGG